MSREIYLDNGATTRPYDEVIDYISQINRNQYGNPSSLHTKGIEAEKLLRSARETVARSLGVSDKEIYFTSGGTESNNLAIRGYLEANPRAGKHLITTAIEHPSVLEVFKYLSEKGYAVDYIDVDKDGIINLETLKNRINGETALISILTVNNETGSLQPVDDIVRIKNAVNKSAVLHMDAVQAYGKFRISPKKAGIDLLSVSSHKIHGPKGVGALYANRSVRLKPILFGGGQEALLRSGTENTSGISGFGLASEMIHESLEANFQNVSALKTKFTEGLKVLDIPRKTLAGEKTSPYIINISFSGVKAEVLLHHLEERNIFVSTGSACSSRKSVHSHVLKAMGLKAQDIEGAVRFSLTGTTTEEEIDLTLEAVKEIVPRIQTKR